MVQIHQTKSHRNQIKVQKHTRNFHALSIHWKRSTQQQIQSITQPLIALQFHKWIENIIFKLSLFETNWRENVQLR